MQERIETVVIGAGQTGLAVSYCLKELERSHILLEKQRVGEAWRSKRWDSFTLVSPNWTLALPGFEYSGDAPDGYLTRAQVVQYLDDYARHIQAPIRTGVEVKSLRKIGGSFHLETSQGTIVAQSVVVATGAFQQPRLPEFAHRLASHIEQFDSTTYRNPDQLPPGAVLVVGSGQSGCQITEELHAQGRKVYLATGRGPRLLRRYRGKDLFFWADKLGILHKKVEKLDSLAERFVANPHISGKDGGKTHNLHQFARDGVTLLGHMIDAQGSGVLFAADLMENLAAADKSETEIRKAIDTYVAEHGLDVDEAEPALELKDGYDSRVITELNLDAAGITSVIWTTGLKVDFSWIDLPIFDEYGYPVHRRGVTQEPGLYFVGLLWLHVARSSLLFGVGEDARHIAQHINQYLADHPAQPTVKHDTAQHDTVAAGAASAD